MRVQRIVPFLIFGFGGPARKPKHESKAQEIGRGEETEMMGSSEEDRRPIELNVN